MILVFDTETTGLPISWKAPVSDLSNWPRLVQIAWILYDIEGNELEAEEYIIKPEGFIIPKEVEKIHGISQHKAEKEGESLTFVLKEFLSVLDKAEYLVAHNISFDEKIVGAEILRQKIQYNRVKNVKKICTKEVSTDYCKIPGNYGYKWPNLGELYKILFNTDFEDAHRADVDVKACAACFFELKKRGVINL